MKCCSPILAVHFLNLFLASDWIWSNTLQLTSAFLAACCVFLLEPQPDAHSQTCWWVIQHKRTLGQSPSLRLACSTENQYWLLFRSTAQMPAYLQHFKGWFRELEVKKNKKTFSPVLTLDSQYLQAAVATAPSSKEMCDTSENLTIKVFVWVHP